MGLKKQINEMKHKNEELQEEIEDLKKSTKVCVFNELDVQLEAYSDECIRMRAQLEKAGLKHQEQRKEIQALRRKLIKQQKPEKNKDKENEKIEEKPLDEEDQEDEEAKQAAALEQQAVECKSGEQEVAESEKKEENE